MFFSSFHEIFTKIDHLLVYPGFVRFKKVKDLPTMLSDCSEIKQKQKSITMRYLENPQIYEN